MIKNLPMKLTTVGRIKIGIKGKTITSAAGNEFQPPQKLDHIIVTTATRDESNNYIPDIALMKALIEEGGIVNNDEKLVGIPFRLLYDDIESNFRTRLASYEGKMCTCHGDNETAHEMLDNFKKPIPCPCAKFTDPNYTGKDKCKMNGSLTLMIDQAKYFGQSYVFKTTSKNTVIGMLSSLQMFHKQLGGNLRGIPLMLKMDPITTVTPGNQTVTVYVMSICYNGSMTQMFKEVLQITQAKKQFQIELDEKLVGFSPEEDEDFAEEFYPDGIDVTMNNAETSKPKTTLDIGINGSTIDITKTEEVIVQDPDLEIEIKTETEMSIEDKIKAEKKRKSNEDNAKLLIRLDEEPDTELAVSLAKRIRKDLLILWLKGNFTTIPGTKKETVFSLPTASLKIWQELASKLIREHGNRGCIPSGDGGGIHTPSKTDVMSKELRDEYKAKYAHIPEMASALGFINQDSLLTYIRGVFKGIPINGHNTIPELWAVAAGLFLEARDKAGSIEEKKAIKEQSTMKEEPVKEEITTPADFLWDTGPVLGNASTDPDTAKVFSEMKAGKQLHNYDAAKWAELVGRYKKEDGTQHESAREMTFKQAGHLIANIDIPF